MGKKWIKITNDFIKKSKNGICTIICFYVDDLLIFGSNIHAVNDLKSLLCNNFDMKDLRKTNVIMGIKITRPEQGISSLTQILNI